MERPRILIACIGNIFLGDDGFGCAVARELQRRVLPENARVVDYGIRSLDLVYGLLDGGDATIFVDAVPRGAAPGTVYVIEPDAGDLENGEAALDGHTMNPLHVLRTARAMGAELKNLTLVGCEPETLGGDEGSMELSEPVRAAVATAAGLVESLVEKISARSEERATVTK
ncbi:MAG: hydrogenase maturation protease [Acidobacteria bacterium]|nr:hydrogenase maturation protease [Acidobacteriota bacterium]